MIIIKTKVLLPHAQLTIVELGYPLWAVSFSCSQRLLNNLAFIYLTISVNDEGLSRITLCALHLEPLTLPEHLSTSPVFSGVCVTQTLVLYVCFIDRCLSFVLFVLAIVLSDLLRCADYDYLPLVSSHSYSYLRFIALTNLYQMFVPSEESQ